MRPRVKKQRAGKAKDSPTSTEPERDVIDGGDEKINEEKESQEEVPKAEVDNGGEEAPPLKKARGRQNIKKVPAKAKGASTLADEEQADEATEKLPDDADAGESSNKVSSDCDDEEAAPAKKGRGRTKRATKEEMGGKDVANGEGQSKEDLDVGVPGAKKARSRKKKTEDDQPEVMPKKKDRGARKIEAIAEEEPPFEEGTMSTDTEQRGKAEDAKQKTTKREKKQPAKKAGKNKKGQDEDEKLVEEDELSGKKDENGQVLEEQAEDDEVQAIEEGGGDVKPMKKAARGKAAAKAADGAGKKKPAGRGKKAGKGEELTEDDDVPVDGKKLRVLVEHCKS